MDQQPPSPAQSAPTPQPVATAPADTTPESFIPDTWPGAFGAYKYSKRVIGFNLGTLLPLLIINELGSGSLRFIKNFPLYIAVAVLLLIVMSSMYVALVASARQQKISLGEALSSGVKISVKMLILLILLGFMVAFSFALLVIPGLFVLPRVTLAPYYLVDQKMGITQAMQASWDNTKGHALKIWGILAVSILFGVLEIVLIGVYLTIVYSAAFAVFYVFLNRQSTQTPSANSAAPTSTPPTATPPTNPMPPVNPTPPTPVQ